MKIGDLPGHWPWRYCILWMRSGSLSSRVSGVLLLRLFDLALAGLMLSALLPVLLLRGLADWSMHGRIFERTRLIGRFHQPFERLAFFGPEPGREIAVLINVLHGDMGFAGPRPLTPQEASVFPPSAAARFAIRPGVFCLYRLRRWLGLACEAEEEKNPAHRDGP